MTLYTVYAIQCGYGYFTYSMEIAHENIHIYTYLCRRFSRITKSYHTNNSASSITRGLKVPPAYVYCMHQNPSIGLGDVAKLFVGTTLLFVKMTVG